MFSCLTTYVWQNFYREEIRYTDIVLDLCLLIEIMKFQIGKLTKKMLKRTKNIENYIKLNFYA